MKIKKNVRHYGNGNIANELWDKEGDDRYWHREYGPAYTEYYVTGEKELEEWWVEDKLHRIDGPARIFYNIDGTIWFQDYYINDINLTKEQWENHPLRQEWLIKEAMKEALE